MSDPSHVAYSDEAYSTASRYRSLSAVSLAVENEEAVDLQLRSILQESGIAEFKWVNLRQARERFAALKMIDAVLSFALKGLLRVDVLLWDTQDNRHCILGRDDTANLQRMYYHLFRNILRRRWPAGSTWRLYPDENSALDWGELRHYLRTARLSAEVEENLFDEGIFRCHLKQEYDVLQVREIRSCETPLCQVADLVAGLGVYSYLAYEKYWAWIQEADSKTQLHVVDGKGGTTSLSGRDRERCLVLHYLDQQCKRERLPVSLRSSRGLMTRNSACPINFWLYTPQSPEDKAPTRPSH